MAAQWTDYKTYLPLWISVFRWGMFVILRFIPALFYRVMQEKKRSVEDGPPEFTKGDVTAIIPVYQPPPTFINTIESLVKNGTEHIIVVADITCHEKVRELVKDYAQVEVVIETAPGKRAAMANGLKLVKTKLTCFVDDDVQWCDTVLEYILHPFNNNEKIAGVGTEHRARYSSFWDIQMALADIRLAVRMLELCATSVVDMGASCVSGRTACYKTSYIQEDPFYEKFLNEKFFGMSVVSGDDKFLTRYIMNKGGKIYHQCGEKCYLTTTFERGSRFMKQLLRWSRNTWRSDITCLFIEKKIWKNNLFTAIVMFDKFVTPFFLLYGMVYVPVFSLKNMDFKMFVGWVAWLLFSRSMRIVYYFVRHPLKLIFVPFFIIFQYIQAIIRVFALFTLYERGWGTRTIVFVGNTIARTGETVVESGDEETEETVEVSKHVPKITQ
jgi:cellulose synthase/poly-beta-1,6-N-acetylglucosamine synthase-like glycosyltransferase